MITSETLEFYQKHAKAFMQYYGEVNTRTLMRFGYSENEIRQAKKQLLKVRKEVLCEK